MAFRNIPPNGFPAIPDIEDLEAVVKDVGTLKTTTAGLAEDVGDLEDQKANQITIALSFNPETEYEVGDLVYYNGLTYRCTNAHTGEWDADDFAGTTIANELATLKSGLTNKAHVPSASDSSLGTIAAGNSDNFTAANDGYLAIYCYSGSSQKTFSAIVRDTVVVRYGAFVTATLPAYNSEAIGGLFVKKGRTYSVRNVGENDITVYLCT